MPPSAICISCKHHGLLPILDLGRMPRSDGLLESLLLDRKESLVPLRLGYCPECSLVQLLETRPPEEMFGEDYFYFSSYSEDLLKHSRDNALELIATRGLGPDSLVVEIASNDGYMLQNFKEKGIGVLGIDPSKHPAEAAQKKGIETLIDFFGTRLAKELRAKGRTADLIIANNVVAHVADQNDLVAGIAELLADDGMVGGGISLRPRPDRLHRVRHDLSRAPLLLLGRLGQGAVRAPRTASERRAPPADPRRLAPALLRQDGSAVGRGR